MRKEIYYAKVEYKWRIIRFLKGVSKPSKTWSPSSYETCILTNKVSELKQDMYLLKNLRLKHKSRNDIEIVFTDIKNAKYLAMSNDVY